MELCPVTAVAQFLAVRVIKGGPLLCHHDGAPLTKYQFWAITSRALEVLGLKVWSWGCTHSELGRPLWLLSWGTHHQELGRLAIGGWQHIKVTFALYSFKAQGPKQGQHWFVWLCFISVLEQDRPLVLICGHSFVFWVAHQAQRTAIGSQSNLSQWEIIDLKGPLAQPLQ